MGSGGFAQDEPISLFPEPDPFEGPESAQPQTPKKLTGRLSASDYAFRAVPVVLFLSLSISDQVACLLPNLM